MSCPVDPQAADNLGRWKASSQPRSWVESHQGQWNHADWIALLESLLKSDLWPIDYVEVGRHLEFLKVCHANLQRWRASGQPYEWVEARQGAWNHDDWLALLATLEKSEFSPLLPDAVGEVLEEARTRRRNLERWQATGQARLWVEQHQGQWDHAEWLALLETLRTSELGPIESAAVSAVLEQLKREHHDLERLRASGQARRWVEKQQGVWTHAEWLSLLEDLEQSGYRLLPQTIGTVLEDCRREYTNLQRWQESSQPRLFVEEHQGEWDHAGWLGLLAGLQETAFWPMHPEAVGMVLEDRKSDWIQAARGIISIPATAFLEREEEEWSRLAA